MASSLHYRERPAQGDAEGLLVLHHGRGSHEGDLLQLADVLDPHQRLHVVTPRAPLQLHGWPGFHWYIVPRVGYPDEETFELARHELGMLHDELWERTGLAPAQTVLGGFSMGAVMSYALGLAPDRPSVAGLLAFSGFVPNVDSWQPDLERHRAARVLISHGNADPVIRVDFAREAHGLLRDAGLDVEYQESAAAHSIDPKHLERARHWIDETLLHQAAMPPRHGDA